MFPHPDPYRGDEIGARGAPMDSSLMPMPPLLSAMVEAGRDPYELIQEAAQTLLHRRKLKRDFSSFVREFSEFEPARHHEIMIEKLQKLAEGDGGRLMIAMPPGHAKSLYASVLFPAFYLTRNPTHSVIVASHTAHLAEHFAKKSRQILTSESYEAQCQALLEKTARSAGQWQTIAGGEYDAVGVGSAVTGRRADLAIIDDPIKGIQEADNPAAREKLWQWYLADLRTRLKPNAKIILIQTRWHEDDLAGRILAHEAKALLKEGWEVLNMPALAVENESEGLRRRVGEALWESAYSKTLLEREREVQNPRIWHALYQQTPVVEEGNYFKRDWLQYHERQNEAEKVAEKQSELRIYGASDYAVSDGKGDYTVHGVFGMDSEANLYLLDWWRGQTDSAQWIETYMDLIEKWEPEIWFEESGQINQSLGPFIKKRLLERKLNQYRFQIASTCNKEARARSIQARMAMGKVYLPAEGLWVKGLTDELLKFPNGSHDDQVDVLSLLGLGIDRLRAGRIRPPLHAHSFYVRESPTIDELLKETRRLRMQEEEYD